MDATPPGRPSECVCRTAVLARKGSLRRAKSRRALAHCAPLCREAVARRAAPAGWLKGTGVMINKPAFSKLRLVEKTGAGQATFLVDPVVQNLLNAFPSEGRGFIEDANDFAAQRPQVIGVFLNGLRRQVRSGQRRQERPEAGHQFLAWRDVFFLDSFRAQRARNSM